MYTDAAARSGGRRLRPSPSVSSSYDKAMWCRDLVARGGGEEEEEEGKREEKK